LTGAAGFIGFHLAQKLLNQGHNVIGFDNMNDYYDVSLKQKRLGLLKRNNNFTFIRGDLIDKDILNEIFVKYRPQIVVNLAAQAGVRYSIVNPQAYIDSNIVGFYNILEACRHYLVKHLVFASSSSVYGNNKKVPYSVEDKVDNPVSLYAATKKSNELMAHAYSALYKIPTTGLRFFTVYGPWGRPDMAYFSFTKRMVAGEKIQLFNHGNLKRDFTYIDDVVEGVIKVMAKPPAETEDGAPYKIYNIGNNRPENLLYFVDTLEKHLLAEGLISKPVEREFLPMQKGDVYQTYADVSDLEKDFGFRPKTTLDEGLLKFVKWYKDFYMKSEVEK